VRNALVMTLVVMTLVAGRTPAAEHTKDSLDTVKAALKEKKAVLVDVREQREWDAGHIDGAILLPLSKLQEIDAEVLAKQLPKDKVIYCHCAVGRRALTAGDLLRKHGYDVRPLKPGYIVLIDEGFPKAK
jgi:phage shock protein E